MQDEEIRILADALYRRVDWRWAQDRGETLTHGWTAASLCAMMGSLPL